MTKGKIHEEIITQNEREREEETRDATARRHWGNAGCSDKLKAPTAIATA